MMHRTPAHQRLALALFLAGLLAGWVSLASAAPPVAATLLAPSGVVSGSTLTFTWRAAEAATFYYLQINDATASPRFTAWYPAAMACPASSATCAVSVSTGWAAGAAIWWVQTWNPDGLGPWSAGVRFTVNYRPGAWADPPLPGDRFQLVLGGVAVLDKLTGLVWERTAIDNAPNWVGAAELCHQVVTGNVAGWRLPTIEELGSLVDRSRSPTLPSGHPFIIRSAPNRVYWSATPSPIAAYGINFVNGTLVAADINTNNFSWWCVRGWQTASGAR